MFSLQDDQNQIKQNHEYCIKINLFEAENLVWTRNLFACDIFPYLSRNHIVIVFQSTAGLV